MSSPISGQGVSAQATQVRIINLNPAIPSAIVDSAVIAIDNPNETYKLTLGELTSFLDLAQYLPLAGGVMTGDITLSNTLSLNTVAENADLSNIGQSVSDAPFGTDFNNYVNTGTYYVTSSVNAPIESGTYVLQVFCGGSSPFTRVHQMAFNANAKFVYTRYRTEQGVWSDWFLFAQIENGSAGYLPLEGTASEPMSGIINTSDSAGFGNGSGFVNQQTTSTTATARWLWTGRITGGSTKYHFGVDNQGRVGIFTGTEDSKIPLLTISGGVVFSSNDVVAFEGQPNEVSMSELTPTTGSDANGSWYKCNVTDFVRQWGNVTVPANSSAIVTLPLAFASTGYSAQATIVNDSSATVFDPVKVGTRTASTLEIVNTASSPIDVDWLVVGI